jgi:hypothetical protein
MNSIGKPFLYKHALYQRLSLRMCQLIYSNSWKNHLITVW